MLRVVAIVVVAMIGLATPSTVQARVTLTTPAGTPSPFQSWADKSLMPTSDESVVVTAEPCPFAAAIGCTAIGAATIWLPTVPGERRSTRRQILLHELGHRFDYQKMTDSRRAAFGQIIRDTRPWRTSPNSPHEKFAEAYSWCATRHRHGATHVVEGGYDLRLRPAQIVAACFLITSVDD